MNADSSRARSFRRPVTIWTLTTAGLLVLQHLSSRVFRGDGLVLSGRPIRYFFDGWSQFDGPEYLKIAEHGYWYTPGQRSPIVWFPLYPLLIRAGTSVFSDPLVVGVLISAIAGLGSACALWAWCNTNGSSRATFALIACMFYPYAWYLYGVVHADSLFLVLAVAAFICVERDHLLAAGIIGAFATASRPTAMALIIGLIALTAERNGVWRVGDSDPRTRLGRWLHRHAVPTRIEWDRITPRLALPAISAVGIGAYATYLWCRWGDPIAFVTNETVYHPGGKPWLKAAFFVAWRDFDDPTHVLTITLQAALAITCLLLLPAVGRRFGWGYSAYCLALVLIPTLSTEDFMGTGRYLIAAFPVWALIGEWVGANAGKRRWLLAASATLMIAMAAAFSRSWYLT